MTMKDIVLLAILALTMTAQNDTQNQLRGKINTKCCEYNTINVFGSASLQAQPDQAILQASINQNGATVAQAIDKLSNAVNNVITILNNNGLTDEDFFSTSFTVYPNNSDINGTINVLGQIASESFQITIPSINSNGSNIGQLIDSLAGVDGIVISGLNFDIKNKTQVYQIARQEAFADVQEKAGDYIDALSLELGDLLTLVDSFSIAPAVTPQQDLFKAVVTPTTVNVGTITINYNLQAVFKFK